MAEILVWPHKLLKPSANPADIVPFTRSGGRTLGGTKPAYRTDLGHWRVDLQNVALVTTAQKRTWDAISTYLGGSSGRIAVPIWSIDTAPYASGKPESTTLVPHSDGSTFGDGTQYAQSPISIVSSGVTAIGATVMSMRIINGAQDLSGLRFSYNHVAYKTGQVLSISGDIWTVRITPSVAQLIPAGADLEFHRPTCVCNLATDNAMRRGRNADGVEFISVSFLEDTRYLSDLAAGIIE